MGEPRWIDRKGRSFSNKPGWRKDDPNSPNQYRAFLEGGERTRFKRKHPLPRLGDRISELTVVQVDLGGAGGLKGVWVCCSCGFGPYQVAFQNLVHGRTTRCNRCAKDESAKTRVHRAYQKSFFAQEDILPNVEHRRRLLNRLAAAIGRCHRERDPAYVHYGGRGIFVFPEWRKDKGVFLRHVITLEGWDNPSLEMDRRDVNGNYEPGNLRFITKRENHANRRTVQELQRRVTDLESRLRHYELGATSPLHDQ